MICIIKRNITTTLKERKKKSSSFLKFFLTEILTKTLNSSNSPHIKGLFFLFHIPPQWFTRNRVLYSSALTKLSLTQLNMFASLREWDAIKTHGKHSRKKIVGYNDTCLISRFNCTLMAKQIQFPKKVSACKVPRFSGPV